MVYSTSPGKVAQWALSSALPLIQLDPSVCSIAASQDRLLQIGPGTVAAFEWRDYVWRDYVFCRGKGKLSLRNVDTAVLGGLASVVAG